MRLIKKLQQALREEKIIIESGDELDEISRIMDSAEGMSQIYAAVLMELGSDRSSRCGREGISAEQVLKLGILRKRFGLTYRGLSEATGDSLSIRRFLNLRPGEKLSRSAIHGSCKPISEISWQKFNACLCQYAIKRGYENGGSLRSDTTTVETNIHYPTDASLLNDSVRVLSRLLERLREIIGESIMYIDHRRRAKAKLYKINNTHNEDKRHPMYLELIRVARETHIQAEQALVTIAKYTGSDGLQQLQLATCERELKTYIPLVKKAIDQAYRRIVKKEAVPVEEKIVSIFEAHSDIIVKGFRDTVFGHKVSLSTGRSCLVFGLQVLDGNPKDSTLVPDIFAEHKNTFKRVPKEFATDGCFASTANRDLLKGDGVEEVTFSKNIAMKLESLVSSPKVHRMLMRFRSGIEGCISFLKRIFSFDRVLDRSKETFCAALHSAAVAYNLTLLARYNIALAAT